MLTSDNIPRAHFLSLWKEAMWAAHGDLQERARLTLELGRATVREERSADPLVVAITDFREPPLVVIPMQVLPNHGNAEGRKALQHNLVEIGAKEVYVLMTVPGKAHKGVPSYLLAVYGEGRSGATVTVMAPFRWSAKGLEEAEMLIAPDPELTVFHKELNGLLLARH